MVCPGGQKCLSRGSTMSQMSVQGVNNFSNVRPGGLNNISKCPSRGSTMCQMSVQGVSTKSLNLRPGVNNVSNVRPGGLNNVSKCPSRGSTMSQNVHPGGLYVLSGDQMKKSSGEKFWESN